MVEALADVSLLAIGEGVAGEPRISMLALVRDAAVAGLVERGDLDDARRRHAEHYVALAEEAEGRLRGPDSLIWRDRLADRAGQPARGVRVGDVDGHATRRGCSRSASPPRSVGTGTPTATPPRAGPGSTRRSATRPASTRRRGPTRCTRSGVLEQQQGGNDRAIEAFQASLDVWWTLGDRRGIARELNSLGVARWAQGEPHRSRPLLEQSAAVAREAGDEHRVAAAMSNLAILDLSVDDAERAIVALEEALVIDTRHADRWSVAVDQCNLGTAYACARRPDEARRLLVEAMPTVVELG